MLKQLTILALIATLAGCAYAPPIRQGNFLDQKAVSKVKVGMSKAQVQYVLGTPVLDSPFDANRWDYVYYLQPNNGDSVRHGHVVIYFTGNTATRIEKPDTTALGLGDKS